MTDVQPGSTITNGASAVRLTAQVPAEGRWGIAGWSGLNISLEPSGDGTGGLVFLPDYLVRQWRAVAWEWQPLGDSGIEHRYVWADDLRSLRHETRHALVTAGLDT